MFWSATKAGKISRLSSLKKKSSLWTYSRSFIHVPWSVLTLFMQSLDRWILASLTFVFKKCWACVLKKQCESACSVCHKQSLNKRQIKKSLNLLIKIWRNFAEILFIWHFNRQSLKLNIEQRRFTTKLSFSWKLFSLKFQKLLSYCFFKKMRVFS